MLNRQVHFDFFVMQGRVGRISSLPDVDDFFWEKVATPILDTVENPIHLKNLSPKVKLPAFCNVLSFTSFLLLGYPKVADFSSS